MGVAIAAALLASERIDAGLQQTFMRGFAFGTSLVITGLRWSSFIKDGRRVQRGVSISESLWAGGSLFASIVVAIGLYRDFIDGPFGWPLAALFIGGAMSYMQTRAYLQAHAAVPEEQQGPDR
jgi:hypothetical protein